MPKIQIWDSSPALRLVANSPFRNPRKLHWHRHSFYELGLVVSGRCDWRLGPRRRLTLQAGQAILLPPGTLHCEEVTKGNEARLAWLGFEGRGETPGWSNRVLSLDEDVAEIGGYFDVISREHSRTDGHTRTRIGLALQTVLLLLARRAGQSSQDKAAGKTPRSRLNPRQLHTVESAAHYFRNNLRRPLSIAQVAAYYSLCPAHFSTLFRRQYRLTPRAFLLQVRLQSAANLLAESSETIKEISDECGFVDSAHFCKCFKQVHRVTPTQFRNRLHKPAFSSISR